MTKFASHASSEPVAIVGMSALFPNARTLDELWSVLSSAPTDGRRACRIDDPALDVARFGIPPAHKRSMARLQSLTLHVVNACLADAGYDTRELPRERTDVYCGFFGATDRQLNNALRIEGAAFASEVRRELLAMGVVTDDAQAAQVAEALRRAIDKSLGSSAHDRVGEMASTIPARVAAAFKLRGRTIAIEAADATSFVALEAAVLALRARDCDAALVVAGQTLDGRYLRTALTAKGLLSRDDDGPGRPLAPDGDGCVTGEGIGCLLLKRLSSAVRDGDRVYASIAGIALDHAPRRGTFRYAREAEDRAAPMRAACADAGVAPSALAFVECVGSGLGPEVALEFRALGAALAGVERASNDPVAVGCAKEHVGHTLANAGLAAVTKLALALHRRTLPPARALAPSLAESAGVRALAQAAPWPSPGSAPRRAGITGTSLSGTTCHVVLQEYDSTHVGRRDARGALDARRSEVAIVGLGAYFADAPDAPALWANVWRRHDAIRPLPADVFPRAVYFDARGRGLLRSYTDVGSRVAPPDTAPPSCKIPPLRLATMDPAQRIGLVVADEVLRSFGWPARPLPAGKGLIVVATSLALNGERKADAALRFDELVAALGECEGTRDLSAERRARIGAAVRERLVDDAAPTSSMTLDGNLASGVAAVIANELGIHGVPVAVEAACASSLAALDLAVRGIESGAYDFAIAGGVELSCNPRELVLCSALRLLSPTRITPFDTSADGFSPGEGCALFLLRRHEDAVAAQDPIHAIVRAVGWSNDAKSLIAPDAEGQALAIRRAFERAPFAPDAVQYVEAHGTGTEVGDQVEVKSLALTYGSSKRSQPLAIGSIKSMLGHTYAAAGAAGIARTVLGMRAKTLPPTSHVETLNPKLVLHEIPAYVNTQVMPWVAPHGEPRRAAVSSFGTGGINYHVLLEEPTNR